MGVLKRLVRQFGSLVRDRTAQPELDREFAFHVDMEAAAHMAAGVPADEARRRALVAFGGVDRYQEEMRDGWARRSAVDVSGDVRYALRSLRRTPGFTFTAVATLAVGLGGAAAVLTVIDRVLLAPLPYPDEDRIVSIVQQNSPTNRWSVSVADYLGIQEWQRSLSSAVVIRFGEMALSGDGDPVWVKAGSSTHGLF